MEEPEAVTLKLAVLPAVTLVPDGLLLMEGAVCIVRVAAEEVAEVHVELETTQRY